MAEGAVDGPTDGPVDGPTDGAEDGAVLGAALGAVLGAVLGALLGAVVGAVLGLADGAVDGALLGAADGAVLGAVDGYGLASQRMEASIARTHAPATGTQPWGPSMCNVCPCVPPLEPRDLPSLEPCHPSISPPSNGLNMHPSKQLQHQSAGVHQSLRA